MTRRASASGAVLPVAAAATSYRVTAAVSSEHQQVVGQVKEASSDEITVLAATAAPGVPPLPDTVAGVVADGLIGVV